MPLAHITLATRDVARTRDFFRSALGCEDVRRPSNIERPAAWLDLGGGHELHLLEVPGFEVSAFEAEFGRHVALLWPRAGLTGLRQRLEAHGAEIIPPRRPTPHERFFFREPVNGYVFEILDADAEPEASHAPGGGAPSARTPER